MSTVSLDSVLSADSSLPNGKALIILPGVEREKSSGDSISTLDCASETDRSPSVDMSATYSPDNNAVWEENGSRDVGELIGWGCGEFGQHGHGSSGDVSAEQGLLKIFSRMGDPLSCAKIIACGASHTVIVTYSNQIYAWGNGNSGQLGCGDRETHSDPQRVYLSEQRVKVKGVACGSRHTIVWLENGKCYSFGNNYNAQLGYDFKVKNYKENQVLPHVLLHHRDKGRFLDEVKPHLLRTLQHRHVTQVACGERHTMFLFDTGTVAGCGCNANGQIGIGSREEVVTPRFLEDLDNVEYITCGAHHSMCVNASGEVHVWGHAKPCGSLKEDFLHPQIKPVPGSAVFRVAGGTSHCLALTENGAVYTWGSGVDGQLGHGKKVKFLSQPKKLLRNVFQGAKVSQISCSEQYSAVLTVDGSLYMWGKNNHTICPEKPASHKVYQPQQLDTGGHSISQLTCGSWHAVAIAGKPVWQPKDEETDEEMVVEEEGDGEQISPKKVTLLDGVEYFNEEQSDLETEVGSEPEYPSDGSTEEYHEHSLPPEFVKRREKTLLTLEEFYAPTPLPEVLMPAMTPRDTPLSQASPSPRKTLSGNNDAISEESSASPVGDGEAVNALQTEFQTATLESEKNDEEKESETREQIDSPGGGDHFDEKCEPGTFINPVFPIPPKLAKPSIPRQPLPHNRPINPYMTRSKTYAGDTPLSQAVQFSESPAEKFQLPREPSSVTNVDLLFESEKKFVINKHVPLQVNKKKPTVQLPPEHPLPVHLNRPKKLNVLRGYVSLDDRDHYEQMTDNPKSSRPHLTRAHTFYGRTAHNQRNVNPDYAVRGGGISVEAKSSCRKHANVASSPPARKNRKAEAEVKVIPVYPSGPWRARKSTQELSKKVFKS